MIVFDAILLSLIKRIENLEHSVHTMWCSMNRLGDNDDELRGRVWKLEHKDDEQDASDMASMDVSDICKAMMRRNEG